LQQGQKQLIFSKFIQIAKTLPIFTAVMFLQEKHLFFQKTLAYFPF